MPSPAIVYESFFEYIELFEALFGPKENDDWNEFITDIKEMINFKHMEVCEEQSLDSI